MGCEVREHGHRYPPRPWHLARGFQPSNLFRVTLGITFIEDSKMYFHFWKFPAVEW